ncbi:MAG: hypothetical protein GXY55_09175 [Phycisphaerae bacterium]|nr:hypothetical protein [Phycisphaerae bacterium]
MTLHGMQRALLCLPLAASLLMGGYGSFCVRRGALLFDFSGVGGALGFISVVVGAHRLLGRGARRRLDSRPIGTKLLYWALFIGGMGAVLWHGANLRTTKENYEKLRQEFHQNATRSSTLDQPDSVTGG